MFRKVLQLAPATVLCVTVGGCGGGPARISAPKWNADAITEQVVRDCDRNGNQVIDGDEWKACPSLESARAKLDVDKDGRLSVEEIRTALLQLEESRVGLISPAVFVRLDGRPLPAARLKFKPDRWVEGLIEPAEAVADGQGMAVPSVPAESLPNPRIRGIRPGFYRLEVSLEVNGKEKLPSRLNTASELGLFVSPDIDSYTLNLSR